MPRGGLGDIPGLEDTQQFEKAAFELDEAVAGAERMPCLGRQREAQCGIDVAHRLMIAPTEHEMIDALHDLLGFTALTGATGGCASPTGTSRTNVGSSMPFSLKAARIAKRMSLATTPPLMMSPTKALRSKI